MISVSQIPEQLLGIHPGTATRIHTSSTRCSAMAVERPARRAGSQRGKSIVPLIVVREVFCAQCCHETCRREISKRWTASHIHLERATVRLSRTEYPICDDTSPAAGAMQ